MLQTLRMCAVLRLRQLSPGSLTFILCVKGRVEGNSAVEKHECPQLCYQSQMSSTVEGEVTDLEGDKSSGLW